MAARLRCEVVQCPACHISLELMEDGTIPTHWPNLWHRDDPGCEKAGTKYVASVSEFRKAPEPVKTRKRKAA